MKLTAIFTAAALLVAAPAHAGQSALFTMGAAPVTTPAPAANFITPERVLPVCSAEIHAGAITAKANLKRDLFDGERAEGNAVSNDFLKQVITSRYEILRGSIDSPLANEASRRWKCRL